MKDVFELPRPNAPGLYKAKTMDSTGALTSVPIHTYDERSHERGIRFYYYYHLLQVNGCRERGGRVSDLVRSDASHGMDIESFCRTCVPVCTRPLIFTEDFFSDF